ncbi:MAG: PHP domain-containing protein [Lutispora sp.]|nr:PHP domain-containing protein [Lutispora sp.]MDD4833196.1 PHP domain-containing protein [Lutispora sp.]
MKFAVDLHIHSALSPCGDDDMTPNNIINMALIKGLDIIAVTDHNSARNLPAIIEVGKKQGLMVVPGIEVQTKEEVHIICLFKNLQGAMKFDEIIFNCMPDTPNNEEVFGRQLIMNERDEIIGKVDKMLIASCALSVNDVFILVRGLGGICIPAHVDRPAYSITTNLGFIPPSLKVKTVEFSKKDNPETIMKKHPFLKKYNYIVSSDAHYLWDISEREQFVEMEYLSFTNLFNILCPN